MKTIMSGLFKILGLLIICGLFFWFGWLCKATRIPTIREFQKQIGCEKIDSKLGPQWKDSETQAKWQMAWQEQNPSKLMY